MLVAPLLVTGAIGAAFGSGEGFEIEATRTVVVDQDRGAGAGHPASTDASADGGAGAGFPAAGAAIRAALGSPELADLVDLTTSPDPQSARAAVDAGVADVAVVIPPDLSEALWGGSPFGDGEPGPATIQIYKDASRTVGPGIVAAVVEQVVRTCQGAVAAARSAVAATAAHGLDDPAALGALASAAASDFLTRAQSDPGLSLRARPPSVSTTGPERAPNVAAQVLIGMMVFFTLFGASVPARSVLDEHRAGTLPRLFTTATPRSLILGGKYIAVFVVVLLQSIILLIAGLLLYGAHWGAFGPVAVLTVCGAVVAASLGLVTVSFAKTPGQAGAVSSVIFVFLGLVSGSFTGTADLGQVYSVLRRISPLGWLLEAWDNIMFGGSFSDIVLPVLVVLAFSLVFFALATFFFRRRYA